MKVNIFRICLINCETDFGIFEIGEFGDKPMSRTFFGFKSETEALESIKQNYPGFKEEPPGLENDVVSVYDRNRNKKVYKIMKSWLKIASDLPSQTIELEVDAEALEAPITLDNKPIDANQIQKILGPIVKASDLIIT